MKISKLVKIKYLNQKYRIMKHQNQYYKEELKRNLQQTQLEYKSELSRKKDKRKYKLVL